MIYWNCLSADAQEVFTYLLHSPDPSHGYGPDNYGGYSNVELDRIVEQASQQMDSAKRLGLWNRAMVLVLADFPWAPLTIQTHLYAMRSSLEWKPRQDRVILFSEIRKKPL